MSALDRPIHLVLFTGCQTVRNLASIFQPHSALSRPPFENDRDVLNLFFKFVCDDDRTTPSPNLVQFSLRPFENIYAVFSP